MNAPQNPDERTISVACCDGRLLELVEHRLLEGEGTLYQIRVSGRSRSGPYFFHGWRMARMRWAEASGGEFLPDEVFEGVLFW